MAFVNGITPTLWQNTPSIREKKRKNRGRGGVERDRQCRAGSITKRKKKRRTHVIAYVLTYFVCFRKVIYILGECGLGSTPTKLSDRWINPPQMREAKKR